MKLPTTLFLLLTSTTTLAAVAKDSRSAYDTSSPTPPELMSAVELEKRRGCTGHREQGDVCKGNRLSAQNSFHNCKNRGGWCCSKEKNGDYGLDVNKGIGREDCGYCFSGKCRAE